MEDRGHAQSRARWHPCPHAGGAGDGRSRIHGTAAVERGTARWPAGQRRPAGDAGHRRSRCCRRRDVLRCAAGRCCADGGGSVRCCRAAGQHRTGCRCSGRERCRSGGYPGQHRQRAARDPGGRGGTAPGHAAGLVAFCAAGAAAGQRRTAACGAHHERRLRDDRSAGDHRRYRRRRVVHQARAGRRGGAG
ncbi:hypothetical protein D3C72_1433100 [compost metagenome]